MTERGYGSCSRYIQREGELDRIGTHVAVLGGPALVIVDPFIQDQYSQRIDKSFNDAGITAHMERFGGECWTGEVDRLVAEARKSGARTVVAIGGGKAADTAKLVALEVDARIVIVATIASTDAPTSGLAMRYHEDGSADQPIFLPRHPDYVIIDPAIVVQAPIRFLVAGMGDALSTWYEARANHDARTKNYIGGGYRMPIVGLAIARQCHETLMESGRAAKIAAENGQLTPAVHDIIEANTLLSGLGFENCGCSIPHGLHNGLSILPESHGLLHGEKVAYCTLVLLVMEGRPTAEIEEVFTFCEDVGLPTTLEDMGLAGVTREDMRRGAAAALNPGEATHATTAVLTPDTILSAIYTVDAWGRERREKASRVAS